jgi:hypothetical protein
LPILSARASFRHGGAFARLRRLKNGRTVRARPL